jgi:hypothetical protein
MSNILIKDNIYIYLERTDLNNITNKIGKCHTVIAEQDFWDAFEGKTINPAEGFLRASVELANVVEIKYKDKVFTLQKQ